MATIYASTQDGYVGRLNQSSWSNARANSSGTASSSTSPGFYRGVSAPRFPARGGGFNYNIYRSFFYFNT